MLPCSKESCFVQLYFSAGELPYVSFLPGKLPFPGESLLPPYILQRIYRSYLRVQFKSNKYTVFNFKCMGIWNKYEKLLQV